MFMIQENVSYKSSDIDIRNAERALLCICVLYSTNGLLVMIVICCLVE